MVGVPRGTTCHTCRRRKVKCDGRKPTCYQCSRAGRVCGGFDIAFLNSSPGNYTRAGPLPAPSQTKAQTRQLFGLLLEQCLPHPSQATSRIPLHWMRSILSMEGGDFLTSALSTLTWGWYGHVDGRKELAMRGRHEYVQTLASLRKALPTVGKGARHDLEILASIELLAHYEMFEFGGNNSQGWMAHIAGAENIIQRRGDEAELNGVYLDILLSHRIISVVGALSARKTKFLPVITSSQSLPSRDKFHELLDIGVHVTEFLEDVDRILKMEPYEALPVQYSKIPTRYLSLVSMLESWRMSLEVSPFPKLLTPSSEGARQQQEVGTQTLYPSKSPQSLGITFNELQLARLLHLHSSILLAIHVSFLRIESRVESFPLNSSLSSSFCDVPPGRIQRRSVAMTLADCVTAWADVCIQSAWQSFGPVIGTFSLNTVLDFYCFEEEIPGEVPDKDCDGKREQNILQCTRLLQRLQGRRDAKAIVH